MLHFLIAVTEEILPPLNINWFIMLFFIIVIFKALLSFLLGQLKIPNAIKTPSQQLDYNYYYHLVLVVLAMPDISWNVFDVTVWVVSYIVVGILRIMIKNINVRRQQLLESTVIDRHFVTFLKNGRRIALITLVLSIVYIVWCNYTFRYITYRLNPILLHPTILLLINSIGLIIANKQIMMSLPYYFNNNVDMVEPAKWTIRKCQTIEAVFRVWHYAMYIKMFITSSKSIFQVFTSPWVLTILTETYGATRAIGSFISDWSDYDGLDSYLERCLLRVGTYNQNVCTICQEQLLNCRKLMDCGHYFHFKCIYLWVEKKKKNYKAGCPVCRKYVIPQSLRIRVGFRYGYDSDDD